MSLPVSLAMGTYNGARFIGEQLESLSKQTLLPAELIVSDDASTDNTLEIVAEFAARAPFPVRAQKNAENLGYRSNFFKAAGLCNSPLIAFCDQDDVWLPQKLALCAASFDHVDVLLTYHNACVTSETLEPLGTLTTYAAPFDINSAQSMDPWLYGLGFTLMFRRSLLDYNKFWPQSIDYNAPTQKEAHDQWFSFLASSLGTIRYIADPLVLYRQHGANTCGWTATSAHKGTRFLKNAWRNLAGTSVSDIQRRQTVAATRANIIEALKPMLRGQLLTRAEDAVTGYRLLASRYQVRAELYTDSHRRSKLGRLITFTGQGGYVAKNRWGLGTQALVRDLVRGIMFPEKSVSSGK